MRHTKEPWRVELGSDENDWPKYWPTIHSDSGEIIGTEGFYGDSREQSLADARRVVACVNACANMSTKYLEQCGKMARNEAGEAITDLICQRDELLAALEEMVKIARFTIGWSATPLHADGPLVVAERLIDSVKRN
jgi:hypothetical protein